MVEVIKTDDQKKSGVVFIVGSPRSGTTLLGNILDLAPQISCWIEPYFIMDHHFRHSSNDCRGAAAASDEVKEYILNAFDYYRSKCGCRIVVDKSPRNSLKIPFLREVFPDARFIHILRDGRDATLSINTKWHREFDKSEGYYHQKLKVFKMYLTRQPLFAHKIASLLFEVGSFTDVLRGGSFLQKLRWNGRIGLGPRFEGWEYIFDTASTLEFNALQWVKCVEEIIKEKQNVEESKFLEIRYEDFLKQTRKTLTRIFDFLETPFPEDFIYRLPVIENTNYGKWKKAFSDMEKNQIGPILNPLLLQLGYVDSDSWYKTC